MNEDGSTTWNGSILDRNQSDPRFRTAVRGETPLSGHTPGHTGYLLGEGDVTVLFWGDTIHSHMVQLRCPDVAVATDSDEPGAVASRRKVLGLASSNRWWVGAAHLPFPGLGHLRRDADSYTWVPVTFTPIA